MKIAFFALSPRTDGGVYQYTLSSIEAFKRIAARNPKFQFTFFYSQDYCEYFSDANVQWAHVDLVQSGIARDVFLATYLGKGVRALGTGAFDLAISPKTCLVGYRTGGRFVVTLHDLQHKHLPQYFRMYRRVLRDVLYSRSVNLSDVTICESNYVKQDIVKYYHVNPGKIHVLPSPPPSYVSPSDLDHQAFRKIRQKYNLPGEYLFYPAQFWFHKNHIRLFKAMHILRSAYGIDIPLVLVGSAREAFKRAMREKRKLGLESRVRYLGYVPEGEMPYLFKLSKGLVLPTLFESLSIPIWEAFSLEVPVSCSNICSLPEQAGTAAIFFNPYDPEDIARGMRDLLNGASKSKKLIRKGKDQLTAVSSEKYADSWIRLLSRLEN